MEVEVTPRKFPSRYLQDGEGRLNYMQGGRYKYPSQIPEVVKVELSIAVEIDR